MKGTEMTGNLQKPPRAPNGLKARGKRFWAEILEEFELSNAEMTILHEACRCLDRLDALTAQITADGVTTTGSMGQIVVHPAVQEARQQQLALDRLIRALGLPPDEERPPLHVMGTEAARNARLRVI